MNTTVITPKPEIADVEHKSVGECMEQFFPDVRQYDYALPQQWVNGCTKNGFDPRGKCVWNYECGHFGGVPLFLTEQWLAEYSAACPDFIAGT